MDLSVVVPTYNEEGNVAPLHDELTEVLGRVGADYEIIVVDDGSRDGTFEKLKELHARDPRVKVVKLKRNFGQSAAMAAGFDRASGEAVITIDADLQNDPRDIASLLETLNSGYDVVCGWRHDRKDPLLKRGFSRFANWLRRRWTGESIHDSGCSLRAYRRSCLNDLELYGEMHRYIPALLSWKGYSVGEIKVSHRPRIHGRTKYGFQRLAKGFLDLLLVTFWRRFSLRPVHVFGGLGMVFAAVGLILGVYLVVERVAFGVALADRPLLLLAVLLMIIGVQFVVFGVLADIMIRVYYSQGDRRNYIVEQVIE